jgi:TonB family protein
MTEVAPQPAESSEKPMDDAPESPSETAAAQAGDPVTMDAAGEAGSDGFAVGAGSGGGMSGAGGGGGGLGAGSYNRYVASMLQNALARDARTRHLVFGDIRVDLWLDADGRTVRVQLVQGTGTERIDETVLAFLRELDRLDERPPASARFPIRVSMKGSRP